jgi:hypothetical protein
MMHVRLLLLAPFGALAFAPGCSSSAPAAPQAAIDVTVIPPTTGGSATCPVGIPDNTWSIGSAPVRDGDSQNGAPVSVSCAVSGNGGSGFDVTVDVALAGKGSFTMTGHVTGQQPQTGGFHTRFVIPNGLGDWSEDDCVLTYPSGGGVASGRLWATVECGNMTDSNNGHICHGTADVRVENCNP